MGVAALVLLGLACFVAGFASGVLIGPWRNKSEIASVGCVSVGAMLVLLVLSAVCGTVWFLWG